MKETIMISSANIKVNQDGLYCINDLHKASGGEVRHKPTDWLRTRQATELSEEILKSGNPSIKKNAGRYGGTYVCRQLVYAYAMWVSPKFNLEVINFFDRNKKVETDLQSLVNNVHILGESLSTQLDTTSLTIDEMNQHGSNWGNYGVAIRKTKQECKRILEDLKDKIQLKLDLN
jgi:hypothetical protein